MFINENISKLEDEEMEHMPIGFEVAFPSLVEIAETLNIQIPKDLPILQEIYAQRDLKLSRYQFNQKLSYITFKLDFAVDCSIKLDTWPWRSQA